MRLEQHPAYVLHSRPYRETSLLLECLTSGYGRMGVVARGVRGERAQLRRSQLEPFQPVLLGLLLRGELATLTAVEPSGVPSRLIGDGGMAGLYMNELVVRLTARQDPIPGLFDVYATALTRLTTAVPVAWSLRRFERDLLDLLGYALQLERDAESGAPLQPDASYRYGAEHGAVACPVGCPGSVRGDDLLALQQDRMPDAAGLRALRGMIREVIRFHLGGGELRAWRVLAMTPRRR